MLDLIIKCPRTVWNHDVLGVIIDQAMKVGLFGHHDDRELVFGEGFHETHYHE